MLGIVYLLLAAGIGYRIVRGFLPSGEKMEQEMLNRLWIVLPASFGIGVLLLTWAVYGLAWFLYVSMGTEEALVWSDTLIMGSSALFLAVWLVDRFRREPVEKNGLITDKKLFYKETVLFGVLGLFLFWIMFYVFYIRDGVLYSGFTVFGDYAPHTAMMRSFSLENNYPTQYPHFGGQDVKYHFMFQFLAGNLEFLGLRLDFAYNLASVLSLLGFWMLLYSIAKRLTGRSRAGVLAIVLFLFRSGLSFFRFLWEHAQAGDLLETLRTNTSFIGYTANEDWGLWNFNVYLNQRHLAFGLLIIAVSIWIYLDWVDAGCSHEEKGLVWLKQRLFTWEAWKSRGIEKALAAGLIIGLTSFWNGAAVIGGLLILMGFAISSDGKLDYLITAATAVVFSFLQTKLFIWGSAVEASFQWGFIAEDKSIPGILWYLFQMSGIFFLGGLILVFILKKRSQRAFLISCFFPVIFAFCASLTPDVNVNHKYIMIAYAFLTVFWAWAVTALFERRIVGKVLAIILTLCLSSTGIYDFAIILRGNGPGHRVAVRMDSPLTQWLSDNLDSKDLILTPEYSMSEVTMSGVMMYMGWPYYAWSAGYDTYARAENAKVIYTSRDEHTVKSLVQQEKISYILFEEGMTFEGEAAEEDTIKAIYSLVYETEDGRIRIYET